MQYCAANTGGCGGKWLRGNPRRLRSEVGRTRCVIFFFPEGVVQTESFSYHALPVCEVRGCGTRREYERCVPSSFAIYLFRFSIAKPPLQARPGLFSLWIQSFSAQH